MPIATNKETGETLFLDTSGQWAKARTAKNPETGETLAFDGSAWLPLKPEKTSILDKTQGFLRGIQNEASNTATFGLRDKIADLGTSASTGLVKLGTELFGGQFKEPEQQQSARDQRLAFQGSNPISATAASILGSFANPAAQKVGKFIGAGKSLAGTVGRSALGSAGLSGAQALGEAQGALSDMLVAATEAGVTGGGVGAVIPLGLAGLGAAGRGIGNRLIKTAPQRQLSAGARKVAEKLQQDGLSLDEAAQRLERLGPHAAIIDLGENVGGLGVATGTTPGAGKTVIRKFVGDRQFGVRDEGQRIVGGMVQRVKKAIEKIVPGSVKNETDIIRSAKRAEEFYTQAYKVNQNMQSTELDSLLRRPSLRTALKNAAKVARERGENVAVTDPELTALLREGGAVAEGPGLKGTRGVASGLKLKTLDRIKRLLWDAEQKAKIKDVNGLKSTETSRAISDNRRELTRLIDDIDSQTTGGAYAKARMLAGDDLSNIEAMENGRLFFSKNQTPESVGESVANMAEETKHFFRIGVVSELKRVAGATKPHGDAVKNILGVSDVEDKIFAAFDNPELFKQYVNALENERTLFTTFTRLTGNSRTAENQALMRDAGIDPGAIAQGVKDLATGSKTSALLNFGRGFKNKINAGGAKSEAMAKLLTGRDLGPLKTEFNNLTQSKENQRLLSDIIRTGLAGQIGADSAASVKNQRRK